MKTDGSQLVAVQRTDLDLQDRKAKALAIADNRVAELDLEWDADALKELAKDVDLSQFWNKKDLDKLIGAKENGSGSAGKSQNHGFAIMIEGLQEDQQLSLLTRLNKEGLTCRALTF